MAEKRKQSSKPSGKAGRGREKETAVPYSSIATHPRASVQVRVAKGWGGTIGFLVTAALSLKASVPLMQACERALIFGLLGYLLAWALSMMIWRQWMIAEQRAAVDEIERRRADLEADLAAAKQAQAKPAGRNAGRKAPAGA